jgi:serine/threonine-protein kinase
LAAGAWVSFSKSRISNLTVLLLLNFLPPHLTSSEEEKQRFIHEAKAASTLDHNNICAIHEIDETDDGQLFISMAYYEGETLKLKIENGRLKIDEIIDVTIQIAKGLKKAHDNDIIHRDIKPLNIIVTKLFFDILFSQDI